MKTKQYLREQFAEIVGRSTLTINVTFDEDDEIIRVHDIVTDIRYTMEIGSDDDDFCFVSESGAITIRIAFPEEELEDG